MDLVYTVLAFAADAAVGFVKHADEQITGGNLLLLAVIDYLIPDSEGLAAHAPLTERATLI